MVLSSMTGMPALCLLVTGTGGQVVTALRERGSVYGVEVATLGRPELDLAKAPEAIVARLVATARTKAAHVLVNAAAYTAVDKAESERDRALAINGAGAGAVARAASQLGRPVIQISTDYVFDGRAGVPWRE